MPQEFSREAFAESQLSRRKNIIDQTWGLFTFGPKAGNQSSN
jgi:hypothetical protein